MTLLEGEAARVLELTIALLENVSHKTERLSLDFGTLDKCLRQWMARVMAVFQNDCPRRSTGDGLFSTRGVRFGRALWPRNSSDRFAR